MIGRSKTKESSRTVKKVDPITGIESSTSNAKPIDTYRKSRLVEDRPDNLIKFIVDPETGFVMTNAFPYQKIAKISFKYCRYGAIQRKRKEKGETNINKSQRNYYDYVLAYDPGNVPVPANFHNGIAIPSNLSVGETKDDVQPDNTPVIPRKKVVNVPVMSIPVVSIPVVSVPMQTLYSHKINVMLSLWNRILSFLQQKAQSTMLTPAECQMFDIIVQALNNQRAVLDHQFDILPLAKNPLILALYEQHVILLAESWEKILGILSTKNYNELNYWLSSTQLQIDLIKDLGIKIITQPPTEGYNTSVQPEINAMEVEEKQQPTSAFNAGTLFSNANSTIPENNKDTKRLLRK